MTGAAMGFMLITWALIFIAIGVTLKPLLKSNK